jgi:hypothetical protein
LFKLKEDEYLKWFDPYYYLKPRNQAGPQEIVNQIYKGKVNSIVGDVQDNYKYQCEVNECINDAFASSNLIIYLVKLLKVWTSGNDRD